MVIAVNICEGGVFMLFLFLDTETEGLKEENTVVEVGYVLVDMDTRYPVLTGQFLLPGTPWKGTGIPESSTRKMKDSLKNKAIETFLEAYNEADVILAHNASFDLKMLAKTFNLPKKISFCTYKDISWDLIDSNLPSKKLTDLCQRFGVLTTNAHTALNDVNMMISLVLLIEDRFFLDVVKNKITAFQAIQNTINNTISNTVETSKPTPTPVEPALVPVEPTCNYRFVLKGILNDEDVVNNNLIKQDDGSYIFELYNATKADVVNACRHTPLFRPPMCSIVKF
jgi:hypothetical protein